MKYELIKELEKAGFPKVFDHREAEEEIKFGDVIINSKKDAFYMNPPTLSELIEACDDLERLCVHDNGGCDCAEDCLEQWEAQSFNLEYKTGKTPEEAVSNLWLALQNTK